MRKARYSKEERAQQEIDYDARMIKDRMGSEEMTVENIAKAALNYMAMGYGYRGTHPIIEAFEQIIEQNSNNDKMMVESLQQDDLYCTDWRNEQV